MAKPVLITFVAKAIALIFIHVRYQHRQSVGKMPQPFFASAQRLLAPFAVRDIRMGDNRAGTGFFCRSTVILNQRSCEGDEHS